MTREIIIKHATSSDRFKDRELSNLYRCKIRHCLPSAGSRDQRGGWQ